MNNTYTERISIDSNRKKVEYKDSFVDDISGRKSHPTSLSNRIEQACTYLAKYHGKESTAELTKDQRDADIDIIAEKFNVSQHVFARIFKC